jgi:adenylate cyclase
MALPVLIRVFDRNRQVFTGEFDGVVELGRQTDPAEPVYASHSALGRGRVALARLDEHTVSRHHAEVERLPGGLVRLKNLSAVNALTLSEGVEVGPNTSAEVPLPVILAIGRKTVHIEEGDAEESDGVPIQGLAEATQLPGHAPAAARLPSLELPAGRGIEAEALVRWLQTIMDVLHTAACSSDFFQRAANGIVDVVGLDCGQVLIREGDDWRVAESVSASGSPAASRGWRPSRRVLARLRDERRTLWQEPDLEDVSTSLAGVRAVVAAPILDRQGEVIGAIYGERLMGGRSSGIPRVAKVDAMLMELLARGVAAGLARVEQEKATLAARVQFEQFFTPELAHELAARPDLLRGQDREVTLLFCDIRGFSRVSERLGSSGTMRWIGDTMGALSECVLAHRGVLVDYIGDELIAMWGAPKEEPDHPRLACLAALDILARLPALNARWLDELGEPIGLGIGINTGVAQVGNTGSVHKFKYGALGNTVNVASRVQGATRYLKSDVLVTGSTHCRIGPGFSTRRLGKVAVVNIAEPQELHELALAGNPDWEELKRGYDLALTQFEAQDFREAARTLGNLLADHPADGPSLLLLSRTVDYLFRGAEGFDPVFRLSGK